MTRLAGRVALVTGGGRNIGLAIARRLAADGAIVAVNGPDPEELAAAVADLGADAMAAPGDVSDPAAVAALTRAVTDRHGRIDVLVNNAAVPMSGRVPLRDLTLADWDHSFAVNARGVFLCTVAAARVMPAGGSVVNISSIGATRAHRHAIAYDATKGAVEAATRAIALDLAPRGIRVNAVAPGAIANDRFDALDRATQRRRAAPIPLGRVGTGDDVAAVVSFLASPDAAYVTGQVITVDGGLSVQARPPGIDPILDSTSAEGQQP
ncbi:SDR family NAD(P)-dependent oxidoreductase [Micromonospora endolithica]|uniref:Glucose 1-dehydrogenase n=1 Tax=Micromonospora endolithica TaxID=230091 RepID=A0A3A9ZSE2_9ACTN|nr:glucose 1-dehydrogenase [Micromonospora endolithica]RKN51188.1 glucose 1-dehydrogenase [Micromonospora endolithica]TWJ22398.1 3-oxoacyl-[acyl-carrier protein] reductase [Micromonospora endolithica]